VFDLTLPLNQVVEAYRAMDEHRQSAAALLTKGDTHHDDMDT
jgi:hypothetical protein